MLFQFWWRVRRLIYALLSDGFTLCTETQVRFTEASTRLINKGSA